MSEKSPTIGPLLTEPRSDSLFECLFGGYSRTLEQQLEALKQAEEYLNAFDSALNDWIN